MVQDPNMKIVDVNVPKPNAFSGTQSTEASNIQSGPFVFPSLDSDLVVSAPIEISSTSASDATSKKPGAPKKSGKMRPESSNTAR